MNYKLVLSGIEGVLVRVALKNGGCCTGVEDNTSQHSLSESRKMHVGESFLVIEKDVLLVQSKVKGMDACGVMGIISVKLVELVDFIGIYEAGPRHSACLCVVQITWAPRHQSHTHSTSAIVSLLSRRL